MPDVEGMVNCWLKIRRIRAIQTFKISRCLRRSSFPRISVNCGLFLDSLNFSKRLMLYTITNIKLYARNKSTRCAYVKLYDVISKQNKYSYYKATQTIQEKASFLLAFVP